jgi:hypothetical protein
MFCPALGSRQKCLTLSASRQSFAAMSLNEIVALIDCLMLAVASDLYTAPQPGYCRLDLKI